MRVRLLDIAHARSGDKGDTANVGVIALDPRWYEVLECFPFSLKGLRTRLRAHDAGPLVVKKRGTAVEPETLRKQLKLTGGREVTVVLTRQAGAQVAMVVRPVGSEAPDL